MAVIVERYGIVHYHAVCSDCGFSAGIQTPEHKTRADVLRAVRSHVNRTGHAVVIESGSHTRYSRRSTDDTGK
jgi:hypothetical protein